jgi:hypothetical protein
MNSSLLAVPGCGRDLPKRRKSPAKHGSNFEFLAAARGHRQALTVALRVEQ